jgi:hypothetical protein
MIYRGVKPSINGYRFRFLEEPLEERKEVKLKRGYGYVLEGATQKTEVYTYDKCILLCMLSYD